VEKRWTEAKETWRQGAASSSSGSAAVSLHFSPTSQKIKKKNKQKSLT